MPSLVFATFGLFATLSQQSTQPRLQLQLQSAMSRHSNAEHKSSSSARMSSIVSYPQPRILENVSTRRNALSFAIATAATLLPPSCSCASAATTTANNSSDVIVRLNSPRERLGLELTVVQIGTNPPRPVVAVQSVDPFGLASKRSVEVGMILPAYPNSSSLLQRLREGPYPIDLTFVNLAGGGDAYGDLGKTIVTAEDALSLAKKQSLSGDGGGGSDSTERGSNAASYPDPNRFDIRTIRQNSSPDMCTIRSRRGDVMEIQYTASYYMDGAGGAGANSAAVVYDSSAQRGTGLPYQFVLGSGDMLPGVDLGLYDMCPGEMRVLDIPKRLGYGDRGNKLFRVPGGVRLKWTVELIAMNSVRAGGGDEIEMREEDIE